MPFVKANDINIYYELHGEGTPLVLIAGFGTHSMIWKEYVKPLSKHYQLLIFDNRGAGQTEAPEIPYSIEMMAEDVIGLMDVLKIPSAHFLGGSMGASIVMQLCIQHRDRVRKAILACAAAVLPETAKIQMQLTRKLFDIAPLELVCETLLPWIYSNQFLSNPENIKKVLHARAHDPYPQSPAGYDGQLDAVLQRDLREGLKEIEAKTLVIAGDEDLLTPLFCTHFLMKQIPDAKLVVLKEQAHAFIIERPNEVIKQINHFLNS